MPTTAIPRVHNEETTAQFEPVLSYGACLRHSCREAWYAAYNVYGALDARKSRPRTDRLKFCRNSAWFCRHKETGEVRVASNACHLRWCPICSRARRNYIAHAVAEWVEHADHPKFLTLTLKHTDTALEFQVDKLYNCWRELRRRKEFKRCVKGGIWFFQIKKSDNDGLWHPHLHCIIEGLYFSKHVLHRVWCEITYGSYVADIKAIRDPQAAANDAAKYASSPGTLLCLPLSDACELVGAMHGRRICGTWGTGRAVSLRPAKQTDKDDWESVGNWDIVMNTRETNPNARAILHAWKDKQPLEQGIDCCILQDADAYPDGIPPEQLVFDEIYKTERSPP